MHDDSPLRHRTGQPIVLEYPWGRHINPRNSGQAWTLKPLP
jgi:hypothetical protein